MAKAKKDVAEVKGAGLPVGINFEQDVNRGLENVDKDSIAIPFLIAIQKMSPQVDETEAEYIPDAKPGMFLNTVTHRLYDGKEGVTLIPCHFDRQFLRWGPRGTEDGGLKGVYTPEQAARMQSNGTVVQSEEDGRWYFPKEDGTVNPKKCDQLADVRNHYVLIEEDGALTPALLSLTSTQIKKSKNLIAQLNAVQVPGPGGKKVTPPSWVNRVKVTTVPESNAKGSWHGVQMILDGFIDSQEVYDLGKGFYEAIGKGKVSANYDDLAETATPDDSGKF